MINNISIHNSTYLQYTSYLLRAPVFKVKVYGLSYYQEYILELKRTNPNPYIQKNNYTTTDYLMHVDL